MSAIIKNGVIYGGGSMSPNPNLLDNPWFTVNQRGQSSYSNVQGYCLDRWIRYGNCAVTVNADGSITISNPNNDDTYMGQIREVSELLFMLGNDYTWSADILSSSSENFIYWGYTDTNNIYRGISDISPLPTTRGIVSKHITMPNSLDYSPLAWQAFCFAIKPNESITVYSTKLEKGSISTLALDTPPNYATELLKCQRYFQSLTGWHYLMLKGQGGAQLSFWDLPIAMRTTPAVTITAGVNESQITTGSTPTSVLFYKNGDTTTELGVYSITLTADL